MITVLFQLFHLPGSKPKKLPFLIIRLFLRFLVTIKGLPGTERLQKSLGGDINSFLHSVYIFEHRHFEWILEESVRLRLVLPWKYSTVSTSRGSPATVCLLPSVPHQSDLWIPTQSKECYLLFASTKKFLAEPS